MEDINIQQIIAFDENNIAIGVFAVDANNPELPGLNYSFFKKMPENPVPTGNIITFADENGEEVQIEEVLWPGKGWVWNESLGFILNNE